MSRTLSPILLTLAALLLTAFPSLAAEVEVKLLEGESVKGELAALSPDIAVVTTAGRKTIPQQDVLAVDFRASASAERPGVWLDLIDGSRLQAAKFTSQAGKANLEFVGGMKVEAPTRSIRSIRFKEQDPEVAKQWRKIVAAEHSADVLVIRKQTQRTVEEEGGEPSSVTETFLDSLEGTVLNVGSDTIDFNYEGETAHPRRERIEGIIFYSSAKRELPSPVCNLADASGSIWMLKSIELRQDSIAGLTTSSVPVVVPLGQVDTVDFSAGNIAFLADIEPDTFDVSAGLQPAQMQAGFERLYQTWRNRRFGEDALTIGGVKYTKGLGLSGQTQVVYRIPEGFARFRAVAGIDDSVEQVSPLRLTIAADNKPVFEHEFSADDRGPVQISLDLKGARRLTILVSPRFGQGYGDLLNLCNARLTK